MTNFYLKGQALNDAICAGYHLRGGADTWVREHIDRYPELQAALACTLYSSTDSRVVLDSEGLKFTPEYFSSWISSSNQYKRMEAAANV